MRATVRSAGGVVVAKSGGSLLGLFVSNVPLRQLRIPKGMLEQAENAPDAALREVKEETGCNASVLTILGSGEWDYAYQGVPFHEVCDFYLMTPTRASLGPHDEEFSCVDWLPLPEAANHMEYALERDIVLKAISVVDNIAEYPIAQGQGLWGDSAVGWASWKPSRTGAGGQVHKDKILLRRELHPRDAHLLPQIAGVVAEIGGPASHLAVVAAGLGVPSISGVVHDVQGDICVFPSGALIREDTLLRVDARTGTLWACLDSNGDSLRVESTSSLESGAVRERVDRISSTLGLHWSGNYKFFKRDLAALFFPAPTSKRLEAPWAIETVLRLWQDLGRRDVRISVFPADIACHAVSVLLASDELECRQQLRQLDQAEVAEVFVQQGASHLAFRTVLVGNRIQVEAGIGQAMLLFEAERAAWPTSRCELSMTGVLVKPIVGGDESAQSALSEMIHGHGPSLVARMVNMAETIDASYLAVEGYYNPDSTQWLVVDIDLPEDRWLMGPQ